MSKPSFEDPVVAEIHAIRAQMLAECDGDYEKFMEQIRERQRTSGRKIIPAPPPTRPGTREASAVRIASPRSANPEQASRFELEVTDEDADA